MREPHRRYTNFSVKKKQGNDIVWKDVIWYNIRDKFIQRSRRKEGNMASVSLNKIVEKMLEIIKNN